MRLFPLLFLAACSGEMAPAPTQVAQEAPVASAPPMDAEPAPEASAPARARANTLFDEVASSKDMAHGDAAPPREEEKKRAEPAEPAKPDLDWGGTTWLSNDDSMSLASAQRVLWALKNHRPVPLAHIRPHELLNYFSFDTAPVQGRDLFSVTGSARVTGDSTLTVALAVRGATPPRIPLDLTLVVDRSGSMRSDGRIDYALRALHLVADHLEAGDTVSLVAFDDRVDVFLEDYTVGRGGASKLEDAIDRLTPRGSTDLAAGLRRGYKLAVEKARSSKGTRNNRVILMTDALLNTGEVDTNVVSEVGRAFDEHGIRLTGVGVGAEFNDTLLDRLTEKGKGAYVYLGSEAVVDRLFGTGFESLTRTLAHDVRFALDLPDSLALERFYGEESSTNPEDVQPIHYYSGTSQVFLQDLKMRGQEPALQDPITFQIHFQDAATGRPGTQEWRTTVGTLLDADPHSVRKARALMAWTDVLMDGAMGKNPCGQAWATYQERIGGLADDAEIAYATSLLADQCGAVQIPKTPAETVSYKVRLESDQPIAEVELRCAGQSYRESLTAGAKVATFRVPPGSCSLGLQATVPMQTKVTVPATGGDVRCVLRGGRLVCG